VTEIEKTYLAKYLPKDLKKFRKVEICDIYLPKSSPHPVMRLRKIGQEYLLFKKIPLDKKDASIQKEQVINLSREEYQVFKRIPGKKLRKVRYYYPYKGKIAEIDVFQDKLKGLVAVEFEFKNKKEMRKFKMPDFCLADVTQEKFYAGGILAGKKYKDLERVLEKYHYRAIYF
jgi:CYTH domain-containing protein